jgi:hypothetical protein
MAVADWDDIDDGEDFDDFYADDDSEEDEDNFWLDEEDSVDETEYYSEMGYNGFQEYYY